MTSPTAARRRPEGRYDPPPRVAARLLAVLLTLLLVGLVAAVANLIRVRVGGEDVEARVLRYAVLDDGARVRLELEVTKPAGSQAYCVVRSRSREGVEVAREVVVVDATGSSDERIRLTHVLDADGTAATGEAGRCSSSPIPAPTQAP